MLLSLLGVLLEFITIFVSCPVYTTSPRTQRVFLSDEPRSKSEEESTEQKSCSCEEEEEEEEEDEERNRLPLKL